MQWCDQLSPARSLAATLFAARLHLAALHLISNTLMKSVAAAVFLQ